MQIYATISKQIEQTKKENKQIQLADKKCTKLIHYFYIIHILVLVKSSCFEDGVFTYCVDIYLLCFAHEPRQTLRIEGEICHLEEEQKHY